jgi:hypothetical protein
MAKNAGYFFSFKNMPKVDNHPNGENSPNLVTLIACCDSQT